MFAALETPCTLSTTSPGMPVSGFLTNSTARPTINRTISLTVTSATFPLVIYRPSRKMVYVSQQAFTSLSLCDT